MEAFLALLVFGPGSFAVAGTLAYIAGPSHRRMLAVALLGLAAVLGVFLWAWAASSPTEYCHDCGLVLGRWMSPIFVAFVLPLNLLTWLAGAASGWAIRRQRPSGPELGLPLLGEGRQALAGVLGGEGEVERLALEVEAGLERRLEGAVDGLLRPGRGPAGVPAGVGSCIDTHGVGSRPLWSRDASTQDLTPGNAIRPGSDLALTHTGSARGHCGLAMHQRKT